jgi:uncharacterized membrane protein
MHNDFPGIFTAKQLWFNGFIGQYGWLDTAFPAWVYNVALIPAAILLALFVRGAYEARSALRARKAELGVYLLMTVGVMVLIGAAAFRAFPRNLAAYAQARYFLPMLPLLGAALALSARGAGRRWGPAVGALIVVLFAAHDIFSQLLTVARYYG